MTKPVLQSICLNFMDPSLRQKGHGIPNRRVGTNSGANHGTFSSLVVENGVKQLKSAAVPTPVQQHQLLSRHPAKPIPKLENLKSAALTT